MVQGGNDLVLRERARLLHRRLPELETPIHARGRAAGGELGAARVRLVVPLEQLHAAGFSKRGGRLVCTYFEENILGLLPAAHVEGLYGCLDYYQTVSDPFSQQLLERYNKANPGGPKFTAGSAATGMYRGLKLWEAAVQEAGSLAQDKVVAALDHAKIAQGPGGPAEMVPGQHHLRMNMYIAQARKGVFEIEQSLGVIEPKECIAGVK
jgi:branched-chain amino acid transport system substrate-binding protein